MGLFPRLVHKIPWEVVLKGQEVQKSWTLFNKGFLKAQKKGHPHVLKMNQQGRRLTWLEKSACSLGRRVYGLWKREQGTWEDYKVIVRLSREKIRRFKLQLEINTFRPQREEERLLEIYYQQK